MMNETAFGPVSAAEANLHATVVPVWVSGRSPLIRIVGGQPRVF